jgi:tetratricopeptide (TPR) repeat protein
VAEASRQAADADALVETIDALAMDLRRDLGESRAVLAQNEPLPLVLTPSLEALRAYRNGVALFRNFQPAEAVPQFREALILDPEFSAAHVELSAAYHNAGVADSVVMHLRRALETPDRLTLLQRRDTEAYLKYASDFALWDESMFQTGYRNRDALRLTDFQYADSAWAIMMSEVRDVVSNTRHFDREAQLSTEDNNRWRNAIRLAIVTGQVEILDAFVDSAQVETGEYWELMKSFDSSDWARADSLVEANPGAWGSHVNRRMAVTALDAVRGRVRESYDTWRLIPSRRVNPARVELVFEAVYGVTPDDSAVTLDDRGLESVERYVVHGVRSAMRGDTANAVSVAARLRAARDSATSQLFEQAYDPMFALSTGGLAARRGDWREVTELLQPSADRLVDQGYGFSTDRFLVRWMLAEAYRQLGDLEASIGQLEALLRERSFEPLYVLMYGPTRFKLGQLHSEIQNSEAAAAHFTAFLEVFTDPDPEYQWMVDEARAALARLRG